MMTLMLALAFVTSEPARCAGVSCGTTATAKKAVVTRTRTKSCSAKTARGKRCR